MIFEVGRASLSKLDTEELLNTAADAIRRHFGYYDVSIFLVDAEAAECVLVAQSGAFQAEGVKGYRQKLSVGIVGWVAEHGQTILANDVRQDPRYIVAFPGEEQALSELAVPIRLRGKTLGIINVEKREVNAFDESDAMALETLSDQVAQAIANAQLFEQTRLLLNLNRSIINAMPSGLCVLDAERKILLSNSRFREFFRRREEESARQDIRSVLPPSLLREGGLEAAIQAALTRADLPADVQAGPRFLPDVPATGEKGDRFYNIQVSSAHMPEGPGVLVMFEDTTEWRKAAARAEESRELLDLIVSHVPVAVISFGLEGKITFWRSGARRLFGYAEEEIVNKVGLRDLIEGTADLKPLLDRCRATGAAEAELVFRGKNGTLVPALLVFGKLLNKAEEHVGYTALVLDVTERRRAAHDLLREKEKLEHVVGVIGAGLALIGRDRRIIWANRTIKEWFGRGEAVEGKNCHEVYCRRDKKCVTCPAEQCFETGVNSETEMALVRGDGALRQYHHAVTPVVGPDGRVDHVLKVTMDVTEHAKKVYQLSRLRQFGELMQGVLDLDRLLHFVLTCVTAGQALGFNRALLLLVDRDRNVIEGRMGVGPASAEEAGRIWSLIAREAPTLEDLLARYGREEEKKPSTMDRVAQSISAPMENVSHIVVACALGRRPIIVSDAFNDPRVSEDLGRLLGSRQFVLAPLIAHDEPVGVIVADNLYSGQPISEEHVELLSMFANQAAIAIDNAENYRKIQEEKVHLEAAYRDLAEAHDKLIRTERLVAIGRMAAHVAHEIRNPLVTIGGFANSMIQHPEASRDVVGRYAQIIASEVRRLENILARVMDFTRPPQPVLREASLKPLIEETLEPLHVRAKKQNVAIHLELAEPHPPLRFDAEQMKQVLLNLFQNALDVMRDGGRLSVRVSGKPEQVSVIVANTGEPIRPEDMPKLFEPFFTTKPGGTGLGLALSQKIIQDHGGDIRVLSSLDRGTEFIITLPRQK